MYDFVKDAADNPTFYAELENPQSLNKYQCTYNNPLVFVDADGHWVPRGGRAQSQKTITQGLKEAAKAVVKAAIDTQIAVDKVAANLVIGEPNMGNAAIGGPQTAPFEPRSDVQQIAMHALEAATLVYPFCNDSALQV